MKSLKIIALFLALLIITLPVSFAKEINIITDANGNVIDDGSGFIREYNGLNQLVAVKNSSTGKTVQEFIHHPTEERVYIKKVFNSSGSLIEKTIYVNKNSVRKINNSGSFDYTYVYHNGQLVSEELSGQKLFIHTDHLGSSTVVTNESGAVIENTTYSPFGEVLTSWDSTKYGYEGKEHDSVIGDTDFHFRKYKPEWALFMQPDTLIQNVYDPQSLNRYSFEQNNPYKYIDPSGHFWKELSGIILVTAFRAFNWFIVNFTGDIIQEGFQRILGGIDSIYLDFFGKEPENLEPEFIKVKEQNQKEGGMGKNSLFEKESFQDIPTLKLDTKMIPIKPDQANLQNYLTQLNLYQINQMKSEGKDIPTGGEGLDYGLLNDGWDYVPVKDDGGGGYYCSGSGCPDHPSNQK